MFRGPNKTEASFIRHRKSVCAFYAKLIVMSFYYDAKRKYHADDENSLPK